jgi:DNA repair protein RecO (recombination protein O)
MNQILTRGIVLRRVNYNEADRIITFLTPDLGKISLIAKGVRKPKSKIAGSIELFGESQVSLIIGKGEVGSLISARLHKNYGNIVKDLDLTSLGYKIIQLINKNVEVSSGGEFYEIVKVAFESLDNLTIDIEITKMWFGLNFLKVMGHEPNTNIESDSQSYDFDFDGMNFTESKVGVYTKNDIKFFRIALLRTPAFLAKIKDYTDIIARLSPLVVTLMRVNGFEY